VTTACAVALCVSSVSAGKGTLPAFGADIGMKSVGPKSIRIPYTDSTTYYGYIAPGKEPGAVIEGKTMYILYGVGSCDCT
jgi:hypothetical protein